jgi:hypothetical protein
MCCYAISHEYFKIWFWKPMFQYCLIKLCPHDLLRFGVLKPHVTNHNGHQFTIGRIVYMTSCRYLTNNMFHMIKHDLKVVQIPCKLHSCDEARSTPHAIYRHLENESLLFYNLCCEITFLDVVITTLGLQFKDAINLITPKHSLKEVTRLQMLGELNSKNMS